MATRPRLQSIPPRSTVAWLVVAGIGMSVCNGAFAQEDSGALHLADTLTLEKPNDPTENDGDLQGSLSLAAGNYNAASQRGRIPLNDSLRTGLSLDYNGNLGAGWRLRFQDQFDSGWRSSNHETNYVNTLKQLYLTRKPDDFWTLDLGRINQREGVANGFNPTDFFKVNALRNITSIDPDSLREQRLGTVMLRTQKVWDGGAVTAVIAPYLEKNPSDTPFSIDLGATNHSTRYLLTFTQRLFGNFSPQFLLYGNSQERIQIGTNLSALLNDSTTAFFEYAGGRGTPLLYSLAGTPSHTQFRSKIATGITHTFSNNLSLTLEYDYDADSATREQWKGLQGSGRVSAYEGLLTARQELTTRHSVFTYIGWQNVAIRNLNLGAMARYDLTMHDYFTWLEVRYHWPSVDLALQLQGDHGAARTPYGASTQKHVAQLILRKYF